MALSILSTLLLAAAVPAAPAPATPAKPSAVTEPVQPDARNIGYLTATQLGARCTDGSTAGTSYCFAFIVGVHDTMQAYERWLAQKEFCPEQGTAQSDLRRNFLAYLNAYPKNGQGQAASVVVVALKTSYPCKPN
ncbi:MAG: Rap1a/Tai family immunity protein [Sphingobium sp.]